MNPGPQIAWSSSPRIALVARVFTFCTTVVTSGQRRTSSRAKPLALGKARPLVTTVTSTSPDSCPTRTTTWRMKPVPASSS